jgi:prepilin-type processing-associated H-X9-DG protein/prepilin-type N-terminal cleavage/methylation domain-containing protein
MKRWPGFTLIEILVVLAVLAVLTAIVVPVTIQARENGRRSACVSNLRQVWQSVRMYVDDNDGSWPSLPVWQGWSRTHPGLPWCPAIAARKKEIPSPQGVPGYAYNAALVERLVFTETGGFTRSGAVRDADIPFPAVSVSLCEQAPREIISAGPDPFFNVSPYPYGQEEGWKRHRGGANYAFCDGHVKWHLPEAVGYNNYPPGNPGTAATFALNPPTPSTQGAEP